MFSFGKRRATIDSLVTPNDITGTRSPSLREKDNIRRGIGIDDTRIHTHASRPGVHAARTRRGSCIRRTAGGAPGHFLGVSWCSWG